MFRDLTGAIERRKKSVTRTGEETEKVNRAFAGFIAKFFPEAGSIRFDISYSVEKGALTIQTPNKTVANELVLKTRELSEFLKEDKIHLKQVIIR